MCTGNRRSILIICSHVTLTGIFRANFKGVTSFRRHKSSLCNRYNNLRRLFTDKSPLKGGVANLRSRILTDILSLSTVTFGGVPLVLGNQSAESYMTRLTPAFSLYRPPIDIPYASFYPPPPPVYPAAHFAASPYYRGFAFLPPPGYYYYAIIPVSNFVTHFFFPLQRFVPVALADSYSAAYGVLAAPPPPPLGPLAGPTNAELAHYLHRYQSLGPPSCSPLTRYLPTPSPCGLGPPDWRLTRESSRSVVELSSSSDDQRIMHDDRNPLPLAAAEAAAVASTSSTTGSNTGPKVEAGSAASLNHPMLLSTARNFCPFPGGSSAAVYAPRCLHANCSCAGQSSPSCPKNVQAGPLTGTN